jgi:hypothetical protein
MMSDGASRRHSSSGFLIQKKNGSAKHRHSFLFFVELQLVEALSNPKNSLNFMTAQSAVINPKS